MNRALPPLHVGHGTNHGALTVFPVWIDAPTLGGLHWSASKLQVAEREGSPVVSELVVENTASHPLVALEGDLLVGGWQDRMLAASMVLQPREQRVVDAVCVEHGRWHGSSSHSSAGRRGATSVRHGNVSRRGGDDAQGEVWRRIGRYETALGATSSSSMLDHLDRSQPLNVNRISGQRGIIVGIGGRVVGAELFGSSAGLRARWQGILDAAALDARIAPPIATPSERARRFARRLAVMTLEDGGEAGMARQLRSSRENFRLSGIGAGVDRIIHVAAFDESHPLLENA